jgi:hypothetical protein
MSNKENPMSNKGNYTFNKENPMSNKGNYTFNKGNPMSNKGNYTFNKENPMSAFYTRKRSTVQSYFFLLCFYT